MKKEGGGAAVELQAGGDQCGLFEIPGCVEEHSAVQNCCTSCS